MPPVLQRFKQRAPKVPPVQSLNCYSIRDALLADEVDLGVFYRVGNDDALTMMELGQQSLALVASVDQAPVDHAPAAAYPIELYHQRTPVRVPADF
jgi:DNA-binding transcriptional LysR family regulator